MAQVEISTTPPSISKQPRSMGQIAEDKIRDGIALEEKMMGGMHLLEGASDDAKQTIMEQYQKKQIENKRFSEGATALADYQRKVSKDASDRQLAQATLTEENIKKSEDALATIADIDKLLGSIDTPSNIFGSERANIISKGATFAGSAYEGIMGEEAYEGWGKEANDNQEAFNRVSGKNIIEAINSASFGQLSDGEREFLAKAEMTQNLSPDEANRMLTQMRGIAVLALDRSNLAESITDTKLRNRVLQDMRNMDNPIDFIKYKTQIMRDNRAKMREVPQTMTKTPQPKQAFTQEEYDAIPSGERFIQSNGQIGIKP